MTVYDIYRHHIWQNISYNIILYNHQQMPSQNWEKISVMQVTSNLWIEMWEYKMLNLNKWRYVYN